MTMKNIEAFYPLSPMQQGMLFHTLYAPNSGMYVQQWRCLIRGKLSAQALKRAWETILERHSSLRTIFVWEDLKEPVQVVHKHVPLPWRSHDCSGQSPDHQQGWLETYLTEDSEQGFDLSKPPLMRLVLVRMSEDSHVFIWSFHHLLLDGWSISIVLNEVQTLYELYNAGGAVDLERPQPYQNYIKWLKQQNLSDAEGYWREVLAGFTKPTSIQNDKTVDALSNPVQSYDKEKVTLSTEMTGALQSIGREHKLTLNSLIQGAWAMLLRHYSGESDIVFGTTVAGRPAELRGVEKMVGLFINTLPVRASISQSDRVIPWMRQLQRQLVDMRQYEYSPLVKVQSWSEVPHGVSLFDSIFVSENASSDDEVRQWSASLEIVATRPIERNNYPLTVVALPGAELSLEIWYDNRRFESRSIGKMGEHLKALLDGVAVDPERRVVELTGMREGEERSYNIEFNETEEYFPRTASIHELIEEQVRKRPLEVALWKGEEKLSYEELNGRANRLGEGAGKQGDRGRESSGDIAGARIRNGREHIGSAEDGSVLCAV